MSLWGEVGGKDKKGAFLEGPQRGLWAPLRSSCAEGPPASHSVQEERAHTEKCATLCVRGVRGREGGCVHGCVEWGRRGWVVLEEEEEGKERKTHTTSEKKQMHNEKEENISSSNNTKQDLQ